MTLLLAKRIAVILMYTVLLDAFLRCGGYGQPRDCTEYNAEVLKWTEIGGITVSESWMADNDTRYTLLFFYFKPNREAKFNDTGANKALYDSLRTAHGDTACVSQVCFMSSTSNEFRPGDYKELCFPAITSIDVVRDRAYDDAHPAGTSLADCIKISGIYAKEYAGPCETWTSLPNLYLNEFNNMTDKWIFAGDKNLSLKFLAPQTDLNVEGTYTISITTADGKKYSVKSTLY